MAINKRLGILAAAALIMVAATGCSLTNSSQSEGIDPPPVGAGEMMNGGAKQGTGAAAPVSGSVSEAQQVTLYFKDSKGLVAPLSLDIPKTTGIAKQSLEYLVDGGPAASQLPKGFAALLPKGTTIKLDINAEKVATVDFSKEFASYKPEDERKVLEAITWTLTGFPTVEKVQFRMEGKELKEMPQRHTPLETAFSRAKGINLELAPGADVGQSTPVTVYFESSTADNYTYYVPVTRMVQRTDQTAKAVVDQLIKGPAQNKGMNPLFTPNTKVLDVKLSDDKSTATVNFAESVLDKNKKIPEEALQTVILSVTESTGASKVQIQVNGDVKVTSTSNQNYSKPVNRPTYINPVKM